MKQKGFVLLPIIITVVLFGIVGYFGYRNYFKKTHSSILPTPTPAIQQTDYCELNTEYENTAVNPLKCICPNGYFVEVISTYWGPCPKPGMKDCPASKVHCVKQTDTPSGKGISNWKSVSNEEVGISFKYPDNLLPYTNTPQTPNSTYFGFDAFSSSEKHDHRSLREEDYELEIIVYKPAKFNLEEHKSIIKASDNSIVTAPIPGGSARKVKTYLVGNSQVVILYSDPIREFAEYDSYIIEGQNIAIVRLMTGSHSKKQQLLPIVEQISSTFKFTQ